MDATVRMAGDWDGAVVRFVWVTLLAGLAPLLALTVAALATALVRRAQPAHTRQRRGTPQDRRPVAGTESGRRDPLNVWSEWAVLVAPEPAPGPERGPTPRTGRPLVAALASAEVIAHGAPSEQPPARGAPLPPERLAFARWLVEHGRLSG